MAFDLTGLIDETESSRNALQVAHRGVKRSRGNSSIDEPSPKRDKLQQELEEIAAMHRGGSSRNEGGQHAERNVDFPPSNNDTVLPRAQLPIRSRSQSIRAHGIRGANQGAGTDGLSGSSSDGELSFEQEGSEREGSEREGSELEGDRATRQRNLPAT